MANVVVLGAQWGDEGKGKIVDLIAENFDVCARAAGGHNAGHTVKVGDQNYILSLVPSGILRGKKAVIGNGLVIDPKALLQEIETLEALGADVLSSDALQRRRKHLATLIDLSLGASSEPQ